MISVMPNSNNPMAPYGPRAGAASPSFVNTLFTFSVFKHCPAYALMALMCSSPTCTRAHEMLCVVQAGASPLRLSHAALRHLSAQALCLENVWPTAGTLTSRRARLSCATRLSTSPRTRKRPRTLLQPRGVVLLPRHLRGLRV